MTPGRPYFSSLFLGLLTEADNEINEGRKPGGKKNVFRRGEVFMTQEPSGGRPPRSQAFQRVVSLGLWKWVVMEKVSRMVRAQHVGEVEQGMLARLYSFLLSIQTACLFLLLQGVPPHWRFWRLFQERHEGQIYFLASTVLPHPFRLKFSVCQGPYFRVTYPEPHN